MSDAGKVLREPLSLPQLPGPETIFTPDEIFDFEQRSEIRRGVRKQLTVVWRMAAGNNFAAFDENLRPICFQRDLLHAKCVYFTNHTHFDLALEGGIVGFVCLDREVNVAIESEGRLAGRITLLCKEGQVCIELNDEHELYVHGKRLKDLEICSAILN